MGKHSSKKRKKNRMPVDILDNTGNAIKPHTFAPERSLLRTPVLVIPTKLLEDMESIVRCCSQEVGWLGLVEQEVNNKKEPTGVYHLREIYLPRQKVHATTTEMAKDWINEWVATLDMKKPEDLKKLDMFRAWFHSHVNMDVTPSGQDESQFQEFIKDGCPWFWRGIVNKHGKLKMDFINTELQIRVDDCPWALPKEESGPSEKDQQWSKTLKEKVEHLSTSSGSNGYYGGGGWEGGGEFPYGYHGRGHFNANGGATPRTSPPTNTTTSTPTRNSSDSFVLRSEISIDFRPLQLAALSEGLGQA